MKQRFLLNVQIKTVLIGIAIAAILSVILSAVLAGMIEGEVLEAGLIDRAIMVIHAISIAAGVMFVRLKTSEDHTLSCLITGIGNILLVLICSMLFGEGEFVGVAWFLIIVVVISTIAGFLGTKQKTKFKVPKFK